MGGNGLPELNGGVVAGEDDAVAGCHGEVVPFCEAIWRLGRLGSSAFGQGDAEIECASCFRAAGYDGD
jgi:hypothetical protein